MILKNIRCFRGTHEFRLSPSVNGTSSKPIILIGGNNGSGKSTLFEAIKVCLYGIQGTKNQSEYREKLKSFITQIDNSDEISAFIELLFSYSHYGDVKEYRIHRGWIKTNFILKENLEIYEDSSHLNTLDRKGKIALIRQIAPPEFVKFFLFDGEKLETLFNEQKNGKSLKQTFYHLIGQNILSKLDSDLSIVANRLSGDERVIDFENEIETISTKIIQKRNEERELHDRIKELKVLLNQYIEEIKEKEIEIASEGVGSSQNFELLKNRKEEISKTKQELEEELQKLCAGVFPFLIIPNLVNQLEQQILVEKQRQSEAAALDVITRLFITIQNSKNEEIWESINIKNIDKKILLEKLFYKFKSMVHTDISNNQQILNLSPLEEKNLLMQIDSLRIESNAKVETLRKSIPRLDEERKMIDLSISRLPQDDVIKPLLTKLNFLIHQKIKTEVNIRDVETSFIRLKENIDTLIRKRENIHLKQKEIRKLRQKLGNITAIQSVIEQFSDVLQRQKINDFMKIMIECFETLSNDSLSTDDLSIDPDSFRIVIKPKNSDKILSKTLSAGEKQMIAFALVATLIRMSKRKFPLIIDTPLSRLDSIHRKNLLENFFPFASYQVILFSTDTEVDKDCFQELKLFVSHSYLLRKDPLTGVSVPEKGYFGPKR